MNLNKSSKQHIFIAVTCASFLATYIGSALNVALPEVGIDLGMSRGELSYLVTLYLLSSAVLLVPFGKLSDLYGKKRIFLGGMIVFMVYCIMAASAFAGWFLLLSSVIGGIATAMFYSNIVAILAEVFPPMERGRALGINVAVAYIGLSTGPFIGGMMTHHWGWRSIFIVAFPLAVAGLILGLKSLPASRKPDESKSFDLFGSVIYVTVLALLIVGLSFLPGNKGIILTVVALVLMVIFFRFEKRQENAVLALEIFSNRVFSLSNLAALIHYGTTFATAFLLSMYLQDKGIKGMEPSQAGLILLAQPLMQAVFSPIAGSLSDRHDPRWLASFGMAVTASCLFAFSLLHTGSALFTIVVILMVMGSGFAFFVAPNNNAIVSSVGAEQYGLASGILATGRILGMSLSMAITTMILNLMSGNNASSQAFLGGFHICFRVFAIFALFGIAASLARGKK